MQYEKSGRSEKMLFKQDMPEVKGEICTIMDFKLWILKNQVEVY